MGAREVIEALWFRYPVTVTGRGVRTAMGVKPGEATTVMASVNATARTVTAPDGEEIVTSATVLWGVDKVLPKTGDLVDLPPEFSIPPARTVVTARRVTTGTGMTPDHVEVTIK